MHILNALKRKRPHWYATPGGWASYVHEDIVRMMLNSMFKQTAIDLYCVTTTNYTINYKEQTY